MRPSDYPAGEVIFREDDPGDRFLIILEGEVEVIKHLGSETERTLSVRRAGDFLGEISLLYPDGTRSASVRALTDVHMLEMTQVDFDRLLKRQPELAIHLLRELSVRMRNSENAAIHDLQEKNDQLTRAYRDLQAAQAWLVEKEKHEYDMRMARTIQEGILPRQVPDLSGWRVAAYWQPAQAVGGDFYDFIPLPDGRLGLVLGDVTGKGIPAALVVATTHSVIRAAARSTAHPGVLLNQVNELLCPDMPRNMFVTCFVAALNPQTGRLDFANAGHCLPYQRSGDEVVELRARGMPLGLMPEMEYEEKTASLSEEDSLVIFSDGLVEAHDPNREMFGLPRLRERLARAENRRLTEYLLEEVENFCGEEWEQEDDLTIVSLERKM